MADVNTNPGSRRGRPSEGAREAILLAARELFAERGYDRVSTAMIIDRAGVSRGAMYHHFDSKRRLFEQLYAELEDELVGRLAAAALTADSPVAALRAGSRSYLRECGRPSDWVEINLRQSREVLGAERWQELAADRGIAVIRATVAAAMEVGEIAADDPAVVGSIYLAALIEAGLQVAAAAGAAPTREAAERTLDRLLDGLAAGAAEGGSGDPGPIASG